MGYWITHLATFFVIFDLGSPIVQSDSAPPQICFREFWDGKFELFRHGSYVLVIQNSHVFVSVLLVSLFCECF